MSMTRLCVILASCLLASTAPSFAQSVGVAAAVDQSALGTAPAAKPRTLSLGDQVIHNEQIETDAKGLLQILLADGTSFTVGPNSKMSIDSFVYDPNAGTAKVTATLSKGLFRFIGGKTSKTADGAVLNTPVGTVGIRGGIADLDLTGKGSAGSHIDMRFGDSVSLTQDGKRLGWVFQNGYSIVIGADNQVSVEKTPPAWTTAMQSYLTGHTGQNGGSTKTPASRTIVASGIGNGNTPPGNGGPNPPGDKNQLDNADSVRLSTWEEIQNSTLADVLANYSGRAIGTVTDEWGQHPATGHFSLDYSFGAQQYGNLSITKFDGDHNLYSGVLPDASTGLAKFSGNVSDENDIETAAHGFETVPDGDENETISGSTTGFFIDQGKNIGSGVIGTFDAHELEGNWSATGAYAGTYTGPASSPTE